MNRFKGVKSFLAIVLCILLALDIPVYSMPQKDNTFSKSYVKTIKISNSSLSLVEGQKNKTLVVVKTAGDESNEITAASSNRKVAKVTVKKRKSGKSIVVVTGMSEGKAKITIKTKGKDRKGKSLIKKINVKINGKNTDTQTSDTDPEWSADFTL